MFSDAYLRCPRRWRRCLRGLALALAAACLAIGLARPVPAQSISFGRPPSDNPNESAPGFRDYNAPEPCGSLYCSNVYLYGSFELPTFTIAAQPDEKDGRLVAPALDLRAKRIQRSFLDVLHSAVDPATVQDSAVPSSSRRAAATAADEQQGDDNQAGEDKAGDNQAGEDTAKENAAAENAASGNESAAPSRSGIFQTPSPKQIVPDIAETPEDSAELLAGADRHPLLREIPDIPRLGIGTLNQQTVIYERTPEGLPNRVVVTVTEADALYHGLTVAELADDWQFILQRRLINALLERQFDRHLPWVKPVCAAFIIGLALVLVWCVGLARRLLRHWDRNLRRLLKELKTAMTIDPEESSLEQLAANETARSAAPATPPQDGDRDGGANGETDPGSEDEARETSGEESNGRADGNFPAEPKRPPSEVAAPSNGTAAAQSRSASTGKSPAATAKGSAPSPLSVVPRAIARGPLGRWVAAIGRALADRLTFERVFGELSFQEQAFYRRQRNAIKLLQQILFWVQAFVLMTAGTLTISLYPRLRPYAEFLAESFVSIPLLWMGMGILDKVVDFFVDSALQKWAERAQVENPGSNRYALRASTYSPVLQWSTTVAFYGLAAYLTVLWLGINPSVLAGAGFLAVAVTFLSRSFIEALINGILILWTDRYAIGDVVSIPDVGVDWGLVENMNLYITQIRGAGGRLYTVPNGQIQTVANLTKNWSRVEFKIQVAYESDLKQVLAVLGQVAESLREDPDWQDTILEPASVLGVDDVSQDGALIQVWIRTQPMKQWAVDREYRLRVKEAFDREGIAIGIPQQRFRYDEPRSLQGLGSWGGDAGEAASPQPAPAR